MIRRFAESSITRGDYSIVGNARSVLEAREIVVVMDAKSGSGNGKGSGKGESKAMIETWKKKHVPVEDEEEPEYRWSCPKCQGII